jgi:hypothetical protein
MADEERLNRYQVYFGAVVGIDLCSLVGLCASNFLNRCDSIGVEVVCFDNDSQVFILIGLESDLVCKKVTNPVE